MTSSGAQAMGGDSFVQTGEAISANGGAVAFISGATNLVANDTNATNDVFVRNRRAHTTIRVSVSSSGKQADGASFLPPSISADGRYVAFTSSADNLVANDTNGHDDVFVRDLKTHTTRRVSVSSSGQEDDSDSYSPSISAGGRFVAFGSSAENLVAHDSNGYSDVFVRDRRTHRTRRVSVSSSGQQANSYCYTPSISAGGRFVAFGSSADNLVAHDSNSLEDVFVRDRRTHRTRRVSVSSSGRQGNNNSFLVDPAITPDGRFVTFTSLATNFVSGTSGEQVFVRDAKARKTKLISRNDAGHAGNNPSFDASITSDGRFVAFSSNARNLVRHDTNRLFDVFLRGPLR